MQYIVLLRGINVGGRTVKMAELKACFEKAGFRQVVTVLQTGNIIVESREKKADKLKQQVEVMLEKAFHYPAQVRILTPAQLREVMENYPFTGPDPEFHRYVIFTEKGFEKELTAHAGEPDKALEEVYAGNGIVYWRVRKGHTLDSVFGKYTGKAAAKHFLTNRNLNTLEKIIQKCRGNA